MRRFLLIPALFTAAGALAWNVTTEQTMQSSVIEEFTGIHCGNCPDGHRRVAALAHANPDDVFTIAIHAGSYAKPGTGEPDYRTDVGNAIHDNYPIFGYPSAMTSRQDVGFKVVQNRADWNKSSRIICSTASPVNLWAESAFNAETQELTVDVEAYLTANMEDPRLNVFILQNNLMGVQSGASGVYAHRHMLRARLTDNDFGDPLDIKEAGNYYSRKFTYTVPNDVNGIRLLPYNFEIIVFVSDGKDNIRKAVTTFPVISGQEVPFSLFTSAPLIPIATSYGLDYVELYLDNYSAEDITTAKFDVTLNGEKQSIDWSGLAPAHKSTLVRVPLSGAWKSAYDSDSNRYSVVLTSANDHDGLDLSVMSGFFNSLPEHASDLKVRIHTDANFADNRFRLMDEQGDVIQEFGPYDSQARFEENVSLEDGKVYCLEITDKWGDGITQGSGGIQFFDPSGRLVKDIQDFSDYGTRYFFRASKALAVDQIESASEVVATGYYDMSGRQVLDPTPGIYLVRTLYSDGSVRTVKTVIK